MDSGAAPHVGELMTARHSQLINTVLRHNARLQTRHDREWRAMLDSKSRQVAELAQAHTDILALCAGSADGTVEVSEIYEILCGVRQE